MPVIKFKTYVTAIVRTPASSPYSCQGWTSKEHAIVAGQQYIESKALGRLKSDVEYSIFVWFAAN